jgi:hypothetical protein
VSWLQDTAQIVVPALTAGGGAWYGAQLKFRHERKGELGHAIAEATQILEIAAQRRDTARLHFNLRGAPFSEDGLDAVGSFHQALSQAAILRDRIALDVDSDGAVYTHYEAALEALKLQAQVLVGISTYPDRERSAQHIGAWHERMDGLEATFTEQRQAFIDASRTHLR